MTNNLECTIGTLGQKWDATDKKQWFELQTIKRSYQDEVISKINTLSSHFDIVQYGALSVDKQRYPLFALKSKHWQSDKSTVLVSGGVHGYETSGVQGALRFLQNEAANLDSNYSDYFNVLVVPCVSPWGYETINRWNPDAVDPNRSFYQGSPAQESVALMNFIQSLNVDILVHVDLHETTDTDNTVFRPALSARDAIEQKVWNIPDGFYLVGNTLNPQAEFQQAIIDAVEKVTHIAPADDSGKLIGVDIEQFGVINYPGRELGLCMGLTDANYVTTTEVYPDSPKSDDENCILAQVAAITGALDFILKKHALL
ncbi:M14 family metallocarboxypeptidase [Colwellia sp. 6_MG-2023]|uniref:M14 family metallopeptidase n=1 Tax=Colwellia sp. 6_MG-2023 TaxID=3062676 RepID=UPI0026E13651|nr:M14 family metallocarboxypeptidase [Colwellia sp. 6_MG-2023]MDO6487153.1 M14 family metallocarboxypeptidase [Colwellia sp. 6_MG-2023]